MKKDDDQKNMEEFKRKYTKLVNEYAEEETDKKPKGLLAKLKAFSKKIAKNFFIKF